MLRWLLAWLWPSKPARASALVRAAHLHAMPGPEHPRHGDALVILRCTAEGFLRSGGVLSLEEFAALGPDERAAFEVAGAAVAADRAAAAGLAMQGALGAACVLAETDGGATKRRVILEQTASAVAEGRR